MKILVAATFGLMLALLVLLYQGKNDGSSEADIRELHELNQRLILQEQVSRAVIPRQPSQSTPVEISPPTPSGPSPAELEAQQNMLAALEEKMAKLDGIEETNRKLIEEKEEAEQKAETYKDEAGFIAQRQLETNDMNQRRARQISQALLIGQVESFEKEWNIVVFRSTLPDSIQEGSELGIRKNNGLKGRVRVSRIENGSYVANAITGSFFGDVNIEVGDELIIPPPFLKDQLEQ